MKTRLFSLILLVLVLCLGSPWIAAAQAPEPPDRSYHSGGVSGVSEPAAIWRLPSGAPFAHPAFARETGPQAAEAPYVALGQPGLSFRYVQTFGVTEEAYIDDSSHLNYPWGVTTDGSSVWIAESMGRRAVRFSSAGAFMTQIGKAGLAYYPDYTVNGINDVALDGSGNVWLVDQSASHVLEFGSGGSFVGELGREWDCGPGNTQFCNPASIAFDGGGRMYVSDTGNHRIQVMDAAGGYLATFGETGVSGADADHLNTPEHLVVYGNNLYVADSGNHRVQILDISTPASPSYLATIGVSGVPGDDTAHLSCPKGVAVDASYIYVADSCNSRLQLFSRATRGYVATIGTGWGSGNNQFDFPTDVAVDASGNIYVADYGNTRVQQFNSSRTYTRTYGSTGVPYVTDDHHYNELHGISVDPTGNLTFVEWAGNRLVKLNATGVPQFTIGQPGMAGSDNTHFRRPIGTAVDSLGNIYVVDKGNHRLQIYNSSGAYVATLGTGQGSGDYEFSSPGGVAVDGNDRIYVGDTGNHRVQIYDSKQVYLDTLGETGVCSTDNAHLCGPYGVTVDAAGSIYVADTWNGRAQKFNSSKAWQMTLGTAREWGDDFSHFSEPRDVAVDASGRVYVADIYNGRVQVFDKDGAYLTTIAGGWGSGNSQIREANTVDVDAQGNVYVTDGGNHRVQKFATGVPGWRQVNIIGFGTPDNPIISTLAPFGAHLYASTYNWGGTGRPALALERAQRLGRCHDGWLRRPDQ